MASPIITFLRSNKKLPSVAEFIDTKKMVINMVISCINTVSYFDVDLILVGLAIRLSAFQSRA